jgi:hypothetical protein
LNISINIVHNLQHCTEQSCLSFYFQYIPIVTAILQCWKYIVLYRIIIPGTSFFPRSRAHSYFSFCVVFIACRIKNSISTYTARIYNNKQILYSVKIYNKISYTARIFNKISWYTARIYNQISYTVRIYNKISYSIRIFNHKMSSTSKIYNYIQI